MFRRPPPPSEAPPNRGGMSPQTHRLSVCYIELLLFTFCCRVEEEFVHLLLVDVRRRINHHVAALVILRECDVVTDCLLTTEERTYAVKSECKTTVRRSTELECIDDEAELVFSILFADSENLEHTLLHCSLVDTDRTATELRTVEDEVIGICTYLLKIFLTAFANFLSDAFLKNENAVFSFRESSIQTPKPHIP